MTEALRVARALQFSNTGAAESKVHTPACLPRMSHLRTTGAQRPAQEGIASGKKLKTSCVSAVPVISASRLCRHFRTLCNETVVTGGPDFTAEDHGSAARVALHEDARAEACIAASAQSQPLTLGRRNEGRAIARRCSSPGCWTSHSVSTAAMRTAQVEIKVLQHSGARDTERRGVPALLHGRVPGSVLAPEGGRQPVGGTARAD